MFAGDFCGGGGRAESAFVVMRHRGIRRTIGICLFLTCVAGCAGLEQKKDDLKTKGVEFHDAKVMKIFRF